MSKDCGEHADGFAWKDLFKCKCESECECKRRWLWWLLAFIVLILFIILVVYLVLLPQKPVFVLRDARVVGLNVTGPGTLTSSLQVTLESRNSNNRIGIFYDRLDVFAVFMNQQITPPAGLEPVYQGHNDIRVWTRLVFGTDVPVAPYLMDLLQHSPPPYGAFTVQVDGRIRWKVGTWTSDHYAVHVKCDAYLPCNGDRVVSPSGSYQVYPCHTDVWYQP